MNINHVFDATINKALKRLQGKSRDIRKRWNALKCFGINGSKRVDTTGKEMAKTDKFNLGLWDGAPKVIRCKSFNANALCVFLQTHNE